MAKTTATKVFLLWLLEIAVLFFSLLVLNIVKIYVSNDIFSQAVSLFNNNLGLIVLISVVLFFGKLFSVFRFPFNIPYPLINAVGSIFLIAFLFKISTLVEGLVNLDFFPFDILALFLYPLVFVIVLIVGYVDVFKTTKKPIKKEKKVKAKKKAGWKDGLRKARDKVNNFMNMLNKAIYKR
ncbi:hypothetical protein CMO93_02550 [Candidatus Woesearchaeota archaeon]|nr:hypothetical protein [Candidatus Woesearchaeota archaeon]